MRAGIATMAIAICGGLFVVVLAAMALLASCATAPHPVFVRIPDPAPAGNPDVPNSFEACKAVCWETGHGHPVEVCETETRKHCFCEPGRL